jgi:hypothetical protein
MFCEEKARLFAEYNKAVLRRRSRLVSKLNQMMPKTSKSEQEQIQREADVAAIRSKEARPS